MSHLIPVITMPAGSPGSSNSRDVALNRRLPHAVIYMNVPSSMFAAAAQDAAARSCKLP
jgi:hypothetical protein